MRLLHVSCMLLLLLEASVDAQPGPSEVSSRPLPRWLTGIIAVSVFLFLFFVAFLVKKAWFSDRSSVSECRRGSGVFRSKHQVLEASEDKVTAM